MDGNGIIEVLVEIARIGMAALAVVGFSSMIYFGGIHESRF